MEPLGEVSLRAEPLPGETYYDLSATGLKAEELLGIQADPEMSPYGDYKLGQGDFTLETEHGLVTVTHFPSARKAIDAIHEARRKFYARNGRNMEEIDRKLRGEKPYSEASVFIVLNKKLSLLGALQKTNNAFQPYQIWAYDLSEEGRTNRIELRGEVRGDEAAVFFWLFDADGGILSTLTVEAFDSHVVNSDR